MTTGTTAPAAMQVHMEACFLTYPLGFLGPTPHAGAPPGHGDAPHVPTSTQGEPLPLTSPVRLHLPESTTPWEELGLGVPSPASFAAAASPPWNLSYTARSAPAGDLVIRVLQEKGSP